MSRVNKNFDEIEGFRALLSITFNVDLYKVSRSKAQIIYNPWKKFKFDLPWLQEYIDRRPNSGVSILLEREYQSMNITDEWTRTVVRRLIRKNKDNKREYGNNRTDDSSEQVQSSSLPTSHL